jgi:plastocyanin
MIDVGQQIFDIPGFWGPPCPPCAPDVTVPVGTTVEWYNTESEPRRVTATSAPPGGTLFDSGPLARDAVFQFVPDIAGTWEYVDTIGGSTGTLTVQ